MKISKLTATLTTVAFALALSVWGAAYVTAQSDAHDGHAEGDYAEDPHAGHDHAEDTLDDDPHAGHEHETAVLPNTDVELRIAGPGSLRNEASLPGEVVFNEDRMAHVVPRAPGIAIEVHKSVGDRVYQGEVLAVVDSAELASAKLEYIAAVTEVGCCQFDLPRAEAIHENTRAMLKLLDESPSVEKLRRAVPGEMGSYRSELVSAYAEYAFTRKAYDRESSLAQKKISSQEDFLTAQSAYKKAEAKYYAIRDTAAFSVAQELRVVRREQQLAELAAETAGQKLRLMGLSSAELDQLTASATNGEAVAPAQVAHVCTAPDCEDCAAHDELNSDDDHPAEHEDHGDDQEEACTDPNCTDCSGHHGEPSAPAPAGFGQYAVTAPFDGLIVKKHIVLGERVDETSDIFLIADTSTVWVNLAVYMKDLPAVRAGQEVTLRADHSGARARGAIDMVTPFVDEATRSATARVVLDNTDARWRPGTFATGTISTSVEELDVIVPRDAVQMIEGQTVVFIDHQGVLEPAPVSVGRSDRENVEIVEGLRPGTAFVAQGAFQLKAKHITSGLDAHAGHGH